MKCKCLKCTNVWMPTWADLSQNHGCPKCGTLKATRKNIHSQKEVVARLKRVNPKIKVCGKYRGYYSKMQVECKICGYVWKTTYEVLHKGHGCPRCHRNSRRHDVDYIRREISNRFPFVTMLSCKYRDNKSTILCRCSKCSTEWKTRWNDLDQGHGCPYCNSCGGVQEARVRKILEKMTGWKFPKAKLPVQGKYPLELDFYNKRHNIAGEYNGEGHTLPIYGNSLRTREQSLRRTQRNDERKRVLCYQRGIRLIRIPHREKHDIESFLRSKLGKLHVNIRPDQNS